MIDWRQGFPFFHTPAHVKDDFGGLTMQSSINYLLLRIEKGFKKTGSKYVIARPKDRACESSMYV